LPQVDAVFLLELVGEVGDQPHVEVLAAEERVTVRRLHLEDAIPDLEDRDIERTAAEVVNSDGLAVLLLVETVGERCRSRLVDDAQHLKTGDLAGVLGRLTLRVVEVSRNRDNGLRDWMTEVSLGGLLHLLENERRNLLRRILLTFLGRDPPVAVRAAHDAVRNEPLVLVNCRVVVAPTDKTLDREEGVLRIGDG